jgi:hypothetical protein
VLALGGAEGVNFKGGMRKFDCGGYIHCLDCGDGFTGLHIYKLKYSTAIFGELNL